MAAPQAAGSPVAGPAAIARGEDRDRYVDLLRAFALGAVVLGHWLLAVVWLEGGTLRVQQVLLLEPATHWLTWLVQVMAVFFLVGGVVNARSWRSARERGDGYATWLRGRSVRLLRPTVVLVWFWVLAGPLIAAAGMDRDLVEVGARNAFAPLWFLAVYLVVAATVPALLVAHDRLGLWLPLGLTGAVATVDVAHHVLGLPGVGALNYLLVWAVPTVLGFCWYDGLLDGRTVRWGLPLLGMALLVVLVTRLGYPVSLIGVDGADRSNYEPPSLALVALGWAQLGVVLAARDPATRWLRRPPVWRAVGGFNLVAMTVFLWHMTVMVLVVAVGYAAGVWPERAPLSGLWWALRPAWLLLLAAVLAGVTALLAPVELRAPKPAARSQGWRTAVPALAAVTAAAAAIFLLIAGGVVRDGAAALLPPAAAAVVTGCAAALGAIRSRAARHGRS